MHQVVRVSMVRRVNQEIRDYPVWSVDVVKKVTIWYYHIHVHKTYMYLSALFLPILLLEVHSFENS